MLSHLLFSISALIIFFVFAITYFTLNKSGNSIFRVKLYKYLMFIVFSTIIIEILEGVIYLFDIEIIFNLLWKIHLILFGFFYILLCNYFLALFNLSNNNSLNDIIFNNKDKVGMLFIFVYFILIIFAVIFVKPYSLGSFSFLFYTDRSLTYLFFLQVIFFIYVSLIIYKSNDFNISNKIIVFSSFILNIISFFITYQYPEVSFISVLFVLILILLYYFKENADLIYIDDLQNLNNQIDSSSNFKLEYLYETVHDFKYPLNAINIIDSDIKNNSYGSFEELNEKINSLNIVSNDLINILNSSMDLTYVYRMDELIFRISKIVYPLLKGKKVKFSYKVDSNFPSLLVGQQNKIYRIILNLLINSVYFTDVGRINITIDGFVKRDEVYVSIRISDTGVGFDESLFDKVFDRASSYMANDMNLYLVKKYVDSLNGNITFESHVGSGTIFNIGFTQKIYNSVSVSNNNQFLNTSVVPLNYFGRSIMIVDSDKECTDSLKRILQKYNFNVEVETNGKNFIKRLKLGEKYNLILLSDNIEDGNYMEIINMIKYLRRIIFLPNVIAFTSNIVDPNGNLYINNGFDGYLPKPINIRLLDEIINSKCR